MNIIYISRWLWFSIIIIKSFPRISSNVTIIILFPIQVVNADRYYKLCILCVMAGFIEKHLILQTSLAKTIYGYHFTGIYVNVELSHNYIVVNIIGLGIPICVSIILVRVDEFPFVENSCSETLRETVNALIISSSLPQSHLIHYRFDTFSLCGPATHIYIAYYMDGIAVFYQMT